MSATVHVQGISSQTTEKEVHDFFSFCGKIDSLSLTPTSAQSDASKSATVTFEKDAAAKTALLLDNTQLGSAKVHVTGAASLADLASGDAAAGEARDDDIAQEDKPRSRIIAEYLAHGYVISDQAIERAIALDKQHGISTRFLSTLQNFDSKFKVTEKTKEMDVKYGVSEKAATNWRGLHSYFDKVLGTPTGQKLRQFYEQGNKQVMDVHSEARHLANLKSGKPTMQQIPGTSRTKCTCGANAKTCPCAPGECACADCHKNPDTAVTADPEASQMEKVAGSDRTKCNCGTNTDKCPCAPGKCSCSACAKNPDATSASQAKMETVPGTDRTKCNCGTDLEKCPCAPGKCSCARCAKNPDEATSAA